MALLFVRALGRSSLGLAYGITLTDLVLAPATPSNTARSGGVIQPVIRSLSVNAGSHPGDESRRTLGAYLTVTAMQINTVTSAMFLTSMAANPLVQKLAADHGIHLTWTSWALAAIVPGLVALLVLPALLYRVFPPTVRATPEAPGQARAQLAELGRMSRPGMDHGGRCSSCCFCCGRWAARSGTCRPPSPPSPVWPCCSSPVY
ncbi:anion permease [Streptomyces sp. L7]